MDYQIQDLAEMISVVPFPLVEKGPSQPKEVVLSIENLVVNENRGVPAVKIATELRAGGNRRDWCVNYGMVCPELIQAITVYGR